MPMPCSIWLMSWQDPAALPKHRPRPPMPSISTSARATFQEPGNHSGTLPSTHIFERGCADMNGFPHSAVSRVELNHDDTINLVVNVYGFDAGTPIEISGQATQTNGAVATFYSV